MHTTRIKIRAMPNAPHTRAVEVYGDAIKIRIAAAPEDGKANKELLKYLKKSLQAVSVELVAGATSRDKVVEVVTVEAIGNGVEEWFGCLIMRK